MSVEATLLRRHWERVSVGLQHCLIVGLDGCPEVDVLFNALSILIRPAEPDARNGTSNPHQHNTIATIEKFAGSPDDLKIKLRNANDRTVVGILEDPLSVFLRLEQSDTHRKEEGLASQAVGESSDLAAVLFKRNAPTALVAGGHVRIQSRYIIDTLAHFLGFSPSETQLRAAYAVLDDRTSRLAEPIRKAARIVGVLNRNQTPGRIRGWARKPMTDERLHVVARLGGEIIAETIASDPREDLVDHNIGDGHHGYKLDVSRHLQSTPVVISIETSDGVPLGSVRMSTSDAQTLQPE